MGILKDINSNKNSKYIARYGWQKFLGDSYFDFGYINSYKEAGDTLVKALIPDLYIFPIMFCYRQYLELLLKNICEKNMKEDKYEKFVNKVSHDLKKIWKVVKKEKFIKLDEKYILDIEDVILFFYALDPYSFTFRYVKDKKMNKNIDKDLKINTMILKKYIDKVDDYLRNTYDSV